MVGLPTLVLKNDTSNGEHPEEILFKNTELGTGRTLILSKIVSLPHRFEIIKVSR